MMDPRDIPPPHVFRRRATPIPFPPGFTAALTRTLARITDTPPMDPHQRGNWTARYHREVLGFPHLLFEHFDDGEMVYGLYFFGHMRVNVNETLGKFFCQGSPNNVGIELFSRALALTWMEYLPQ